MATGGRDGRPSGLSAHRPAARARLRRAPPGGCAPWWRPTSWTRPAPSSASDALDRRDETWRWLATLKPQQRAVLVLRFYEDLPDAEIADLLGCSPATVRSHAFRGLAALRAHLAPTGADR